MKKRNYGIDLLRLVAMYMIVILHVLGNGGVLEATNGLKNSLAWFMEIGSYCAVNCYAIISGYVCYHEQEKEYHYEKFLHFWIQVFSYSFGITFLVFLLRPEKIGIDLLIKCLMPIASRQYWYASAYAGLFFMIPWINKMIRSCNKKEMSKLIFTIIVVYVIYITFANEVGDCFNLENGYSFAWLVILYVIGAWMKKCDIPNKSNKIKLFIGIVISAMITWLLYLSKLPLELPKLLVNYTSVTIVYIAFALVAIFANIQLKTKVKRVVACFAPAAFGVYLIHVQVVVWGKMTNKFVWIAELSGWKIPGVVCGIAFCIFAVCIFIEKIRLILFDLLNIDDLVDNIALVLKKVVQNKLSVFHE